MSESKSKLKLQFKATNGYSSKEEHFITERQFLDIQKVLSGDLAFSNNEQLWRVKAKYDELEEMVDSFYHPENESDETGLDDLGEKIAIHFGYL